MSMDATIIVGAVGAVCTVFFSYIAYAKGKKDEHRVEGENKGVILSDIGYIKSGIDDLKREQRETKISMSGLSERVTRCEESTKQAHKRIDGLEGG